MIRKLLKYDIRALYKVIFFVSVAAIVSSVLGGFALRYLDYYNSEYQEFDMTDAEQFAMSVANFTFFVSVLAVIATVVVITVLVFSRFYKNLYTDEGYLTFTLPASHREILISKTANAVIWTCYQILLSLICIFIYDFICDKTIDALNVIWELIAGGFDAVGAWMIVYIFLGAVATLGSLAFSVCLIQLCITIGALLARRAKLIVGIASYYAITAVLNFILQIFFTAFILGGLDMFFGFLFDQSFIGRHIIYTAIMLSLSLIALGLAAVMHFATKRLIDKKLNLA